MSNRGVGQHPALAAPSGPPVQAVEAPVNTGFGLPVYWPGDHVHTEKYDNVDYFFKPREVTRVFSTFTHKREPSTGKLLLAEPLVRKLTPDDIVSGLLEKAHSKGLRAMTGDPATDERIKLEAREAYIPWRIEECDTIIGLHAENVAIAMKYNHRPPRPNAAWRLAKTDLIRLESLANEAKRYLCTEDGEDFDSKEAGYAWARMHYPDKNPIAIIKDTRETDTAPAASEVVVTTAEPAEEDAPKGRRGKAKSEPKPEPVDPNVVRKNTVFMRAGMEGVSLPPELLEGLRSEDPEILTVALDEAEAFLLGPQG